MDRNDASELTDLQMHWDEAYIIGLDGDIWSARFRASTDELRAHTCTELRELIRADYAYRQKAGLAIREHGHHEDGGQEDSGQEDSGQEDSGQEDSDAGLDDSYEDEDDRAAALVRQHAERVNFAAIRGERMST
jgi:hypothetical protein